jgi:hypothetical protein
MIVHINNKKKKSHVRAKRGTLFALKKNRKFSY